MGILADSNLRLVIGKFKKRGGAPKISMHTRAYIEGYALLS